MSLSKVIESARGELGVTENPAGSNRVKYWTDFGPAFQGQPWCCAFLWWCFDEAGESAAFFGGAKTASCGTLLRWYREQGLTVPVSEVQPGDIVILDSCYPLPPFTEKTNTPEDRRLLVNGETASWLLAHGVKAVGFGDGVSIENRNEDVCPFHDVLLGSGVPFIEVLKNLEALTTDTFFMSFVPLPIAGLDSCPVRAYAIEGMPGFTR